MLLRIALRAALRCIALAGLFMAPTSASADISYLYDALGRLISVVDPNAGAAIYEYDKVGNLLSISRQAADVLTIIDVTPGTGSVGSAVTISGTGFSPIASQNAVTFNGTPAIVASSTATQITTSGRCQVE